MHNTLRNACWPLVFLVAFVLLSNNALAIQISEIMYDPIDKEPDGEWLELYNNDSFAVNLTNFKIFESNYKRSISLVEGSFILEPNDYVVICRNATLFQTNYPNYAKSLLQSTFSLSNSGETIQLLDDNDTIIASVSYDSSMGASNNSKSLQLINGNWCEGEPTPGLANICANKQQQEQYDLKIEVKIQNATQNSEVKDLFKLTNLDYESGQPYLNVTVKYNATIGANLEFESSFTVQFKSSKSTGTGTWTPSKAGTYILCGEIVESSFPDPDLSNNIICSNIEVAQKNQSQSSENESSKNETKEKENETSPIIISIISLPPKVKQGENFTVQINIINSFNETKSANVYSYAYNNSALATEGGWTGNMQTIELISGKNVVNLTNKIKTDAILGIYSFKIRVVVDSKKYDKTSTIEILEGNKNYDAEISNESSLTEKQDNQNVENIENSNVKSNVKSLQSSLPVWNSGKTAIGLAYWLFTAVLLIFVLLLLLPHLRKQNT